SLTHGSLDFWITFREGLRVEEYAEILAEKSDIDAIEFILAAKPFEGQLFPDTYLIPQTASPQDVVDILVFTFERKSPTQDQDTIIIASLIEREARHVQDRLLVSSVLHNRLNLGMALQIDATVQYVIGEKDDWWPNNLTREQLAIKSPYNTYLNAGLPPQPIANPGSDSLEAALNPAETDYLYYLSDSAGFNHYATDLEGHNQNIVEFLK
ncbi:MAG TPA: endolytic transglycosylase MltG, partial [Patescibacteria group bacterium]|nr:endolytic transglycosylase MltG [Patescibacteria group bacterium]